MSHIQIVFFIYFNFKGMERKELLDIIKSLHHGEKIRIEYKPLFSKRVFIDTEYLVNVKK